MGKSKNKQQKGGLGVEPKETKEQKRQRLADEAKAKEVRIAYCLIKNSFCGMSIQYNSGSLIIGVDISKI